MPMLERNPVPNETSWNVKDDRSFGGMISVAIGEHGPHARPPLALKLAIPLPCVFGVGPAVLEGKHVRSYRALPSDRLVPEEYVAPTRRK
jgi:hypothetical protein